MGLRFRPLAAALLLGLLVAPQAAQGKPVAQARRELLAQSLRYLNVPYLWGGAHPGTGLDCSAFVRLVYHGAGFDLPRVAWQQFSALRSLRPREVLPGDLLFFSMSHPGSRQVDHVGMYLGKGLFIHASTANGVHVESIAKPYYMARLIAARRYAGF